MESRELYKQKYEAQIHEWKAKVEGIKAHADKLSAQARLELHPHVEAVHSRFEAATARFHELAEATDERWDEVRKSADHAWGELKAAVEGAYDAMKSTRSQP